ncbi:hypothetical protein [Ferrovibrio sp.]|uniref:hypothetical protein n=1 Tax=Ferrovibrio sp. TaxID=1917215 RepID=UPI003D29CD9C
MSVLVVVEGNDPEPALTNSGNGIAENLTPMELCGSLQRAANPEHGEIEAMPKRFRNKDIAWRAYRGLMRIQRGEQETAAEYSIVAPDRQPLPFAAFTDGQRVRDALRAAPFKFMVPGTRSRLGFAYASCNGFSDPKKAEKLDDLNAMWRFMQDRQDGCRSKPVFPHAKDYDLPPGKHRANHVLLLGGDQIYADNIYHDLDWLKRLNAKRQQDFRDFALQAHHRADLEAFYFALYVDRWSTITEPRGHCIHSFATTPTLSMWDDHDIVDGWGSYDDAENQADVSVGIFDAARNGFRLFQQHLPLEGMADAADATNMVDVRVALSSINVEDRPTPTGTFSFAHRIDDIGIIAVDARSKRSRKAILDRDGWTGINNLLKQVSDDGKGPLRHVIVMLGIPAMHADYSRLAPQAGSSSATLRELQDDMFDHWATREQRGERSRLMQTLFDHARDKYRVTLASGDVHIAVAAVIHDQRSPQRYNGDEIFQLTSSAIIHPPPSYMQLAGMELLFMHDEERISEGINGRRITIGDGGPKSLRARNWMSLEFEAPHKNPEVNDRRDDTLWVNWFAEDETDSPYELPIKAVT